MHKLTKAEIRELRGIQAREREIKEKYLFPLDADFKDYVADLETRLALQPGSIGTTHILEPVEGVVLEK